MVEVEPNMGSGGSCCTACITEGGATYKAGPKPENCTGVKVLKACRALGGRASRIPGGAMGCVGAKSWTIQAYTTPVQGGVEVALLL
jgi:hypothetical protein